MSPEPPSSFGDDVRQIADAAVAEWHAIDSALSPIIGRRGVTALYKRTVHLAVADRPWLAAAYSDPLAPLDIEALHTALSRQPRARAAEASEAIATTFRSLLAGLIGPALAQQLLPSVQPRNSGGAAAANDSS